MSEKRYQDCGWLERLRLHKAYLKVPSVAINMWLSYVIFCHPNRRPESFENCWGVAVGLAQCEMNWYFTMEEVWDNLTTTAMAVKFLRFRVPGAIITFISEALERRIPWPADDDFEE